MASLCLCDFLFILSLIVVVVGKVDVNGIEDVSVVVDDVDENWVVIFVGVVEEGDVEVDVENVAAAVDVDETVVDEGRVISPFSGSSYSQMK